MSGTRKGPHENREENSSGEKSNPGVYAVTDGRHFESRAEVRMIASSGGDVIGQSLCPEVYLAREIGACYAGIYLIVNRAEGIGPDWRHSELKAIFYEEAVTVGKIIIGSLKQINRKRFVSVRGYGRRRF